jgi:hypothetical protein
VPSSARAPIAIAALLFCVYAVAVAADAGRSQRLTAAEAHVLLTAESIAADGDFDVANQHDERAWRRWYGGVLRPTAAPDAAGRVAEPQGVGFPLLVAPAWRLGGVTAVQLWLAALMAIAFACAAGLARRVVPDPWATAAALVGGLSPPALAAATAIRPEAAAAAALAGAALLALRVRDAPRAAPAFWAALLVAAVPWLTLGALAPAAVVAFAVARWLRRRQRGLAGFVALEVVFVSAVVFITVNDRLYGGPTPYAGRLGRGSPTGLEGAGDVLARLPRLGVALFDLVRWAPFAALALVSLWLLWRSRRDRLAAALGEQVHAEVAAAFLALVATAQLAEAALLAPDLHGDWFPTRFAVPALPLAMALGAWALRRFPRAGGTLAAATVALSAWQLASGGLG